jgi:glycosyltransferase involved in cell wall biosynthesis
MLAEGCARAGANVTVCGPPGAAPLFGEGVRYEAVALGSRLRPAADLAAVRRLRQLLGELAPAVVHAHGLRAGAAAALAMRRGPGRPALAITVHNGPPGPAGQAAVYALLERIVARRADLVLCVSADLAARMRRRGARDVGLAVVPAPPAASPSPTSPVPWPAADDRPVVLAVARLAKQKGLDTLLAAAALWRDLRPRPLVVIAGDGPLAGALAGLGRDVGADARFIGWRDDVPALLAAADVFVLPSRWEGQPLALQEALRAGRPVVATDVGGVRALTGDQAALLVPPGDPAALAAAVRRVLREPELARRLSAAALGRAAGLPTAADAIAQVLALYDRLAG